MSQASLLVLAAGMGSRYGGLKQIEPIGPNNEIIIDYSVYDALRAGFERVIFVIRRDIEHAFRETIGKRFEDKTDVEYAYQELDAIPTEHTAPPDRKKPWGTGHAVMMSDGLIREPFAAINADDFYGPQSYRILFDHLVGTPDTDVPTYAMAGFRLRNTLSEAGSVSRGVCTVDESGYLQSIREIAEIVPAGPDANYKDDDGSQGTLSGDTPVSMNCWGFGPSLFPRLRRDFGIFLEEHGDDPKAEFHLPTAVNRLIDSGEARIRVLPTPEAWCGVTYQADKPRVVEHITTLIEKRIYPSNLWSGE